MITAYCYPTRYCEDCTTLLLIVQRNKEYEFINPKIGSKKCHFYCFLPEIEVNLIRYLNLNFRFGRF
jgi:hypothetical protein